MYQAINDYVIATQRTENITSASGIITTATGLTRFQIVKTNELTKDLQDKLVVADKTKFIDGQYHAIDYKDIIAVVE